MFFNKFVVLFLTISWATLTKSKCTSDEVEDKTQFFKSITIQVYHNDTPVTILRADTVNNEYDATEIVIEDENVPVLKSGAFSNLLLLKFISLRRNDINEIEPYTFENLPKLQIINLNFNFIKRIPQNVFTNLSIVKLYLKGNGIETLDPFAFKNLTFLTELDLSSNHIKTIPQYLFRFTKNLKYIDLQYNNLGENHKRGVIYYIGYFEEAFSNNVIDEYSLLDLSYNNYTYIDQWLFQGVLCLKHISLKNNNIKKINDYAFVDFAYIGGLNLEGNNLEELSDRVMTKLEQAEYINMENNPWKADFVCKYEKWCIAHNITNTMDNINCTDTNLTL